MTGSVDNIDPMTRPVGSGSGGGDSNTSLLKGIIDLVEMKAYVYYDDLGKDIRVEEIPEDMADKAAEYHEKLLESVAEQDDDIMVAAEVIVIPLSCSCAIQSIVALPS